MKVVERGRNLEVVLPSEERIFLRSTGRAEDLLEGRLATAVGQVSDDGGEILTRNLVVYTARDRGDVHQAQATLVRGALSREDETWYVVHPQGRVRIVPAAGMSQVTLAPGTVADVKRGGHIAAFGQIDGGSVSRVTFLHVYHGDGEPSSAPPFEGVVVASGRDITEVTVDAYLFQDLGAPVPPKSPTPTFMTTSASGQTRLWMYQRAPEQYALFGADIDTGQVTTLDLGKHVADSNGHICMFPYQDRSIFIWAGRHPGQFFRYDIASDALTPLGDGFEDMSYVLGYAMEGTTRMFVGAYPSTRVASVDFSTEKVQDWGCLADDERQKYIIGPVLGGDGILYCPVGLHHGELYALDLSTGEKKQIIPAGWEGKIPSVRVVEDGTVWGTLGARHFRCRADGVDVVDEPPDPPEPVWRSWQFKAPWPYRNGDAFLAAPWRFLRIVHKDGVDHLLLTHVGSNEQRSVALDSPVSASGMIYAIGAALGGRIYGGTISPANTFSYDPSNNAFRYYPRFFGGGSIQVYDILALPGGGMLQSSYGDASLDWFDPAAPQLRETNPAVVARLAKSHEQERIFYLKHGPDGNVYFGTIPVKAILGGALGRYQPGDHTVTLWRGLLPDQSIRDVAPVPETGEVFAVGSITGGTSAIPSREETAVFLWNCSTESISWMGTPIPGATDYPRVVRAPNGYLAGIARTKTDTFYYVFDPRERRIRHIGAMPAGLGRFPHLCDNPLPSGEILGMAGRSLYAIDAPTGRMRILVTHPSLEYLHGMEYHDGWLYYGSRSHLWRVKL